MILIDTSIWVDHLRQGNPALVRLLENGQALIHPFVIGELALGRMDNRDVVLSSLKGLPQSLAATDAEVLDFIDAESLEGSGIGYIDAHLLAATRLNVGARLWTRDKRLSKLAERLRLAA